VEHFGGNRFSGNRWERRGKKYKAAVMSALKQLYGNQNNDKDCQSEESNASDTSRRLRTDSICSVATEAGLPTKR